MNDYFDNPLNPDTKVAIAQTLLEAAIQQKLGTTWRDLSNRDIPLDLHFPDMSAEEGQWTGTWTDSDEWVTQDATGQRPQDAAYVNIWVYTDLSDGRCVVTPMGHYGLN